MLKELIEIESKIAQRLSQSHTTLSAAESCTGGMISHVITSIPGASEYYLGSVTSYAVCIKKDVLGIPSDLIEKYGVVSEEVARAMAEGVRNLMHSTYSIATTGLAGPGGDDRNPEGTVCIAVSGPEGTFSRKIRCSGNRSENIEAFTLNALRMLLSIL